MNTLYTVVTVIFDMSGKTYSYYTDVPDLVVGDKVIVLARSTFKVAKVAQVTGLSKAAIDRATNLIHSRIDTIEYAGRVERLHTYQEIKNELRQAKEQHDEMFIYQTIAKDNPKVQALLDKLDGLNAPKLEDHQE